MTINDGFGDQLTPSELIGRYERWAHTVANALLPPTSPDHDDLVQEARIAVWRAASNPGFDMTVPGAPKFIAQAAQWQMRNVVERHKWTGQETTRGVRREDRHQETASLEELTDEGTTPVLAQLFDDLDLAYHHGEVYAAINRLSEPHRHYVVARFWGGLTDPEIKAREGRDLGSQWRMRNGIRDQLRRDLAHLATVVAA